MVSVSQYAHNIRMLEKKYKKKFFLALFLVFIVIMVLFSFNMQRMLTHTSKVTTQIAQNIKEKDLIDTVDNTIIRIINGKRNIITQKEQMLSFIKLDILDNRYQNAGHLDKLKSKMSNYPHFSGVNIGIFSSENKVVYTNTIITAPTKNEFVYEMQKTGLIFEVFDIDDYRIVLWVDNAQVKTELIKYMTRAIHSMEFSKNQYIWINEVLDFDGGDGYAVRRIHPNLKDSEGQFISTNVIDIKGNW